jgi:hypothetical protein
MPNELRGSTSNSADAHAHRTSRWRAGAWTGWRQRQLQGFRPGMWRGRARRTLRFIAQPSIWGPVVKQALVWEMRGPSPLLPFARSRLPAGPNLRPRPALPGLLDGQALLLAGVVWTGARPRLLPDASHISEIVPSVFADKAAYILGDKAGQGEARGVRGRNNGSSLCGIPGGEPYICLEDRQRDRHRLHVDTGANEGANRRQRSRLSPRACM